MPKMKCQTMKKPLQKKQSQRWKHLDPSGQQGIFYEEAFRFILKRERSRADRANRPFSLVVFNLPESGTSRSAGKILDAIAKRIRITDSVGWLDTSSAGVLLPDTPGEGARTFLSQILHAVSDIKPPPDACIYTYPDRTGTDELFSGISDAERFFNQTLAGNPPCVRQAVERIGAGLCLILLSPLMMLIALVVKRASPGPAFYRQWRIGHKGNLFRCFKFRTMHLNVSTEAHENHFKTLMETDVPMRKLDEQDDPRIFNSGRLLRSASLDELPQLFNILRGEMSLIGPRPAIPAEYRNYLLWQRHRIDVLPGLTGLWQVNGKNNTTFTEMMRLDMRYARHKSVRMDLGIIIKTFPLLIRQYAEDRRAGNIPPATATDRPLCGDAPKIPTLENQ
jgi:lipopolysaccharide/colanic/teichoic acid biosynthesis glycosyltransferase